MSADLWHVYMLRCADGTLYTGIAKDIERRIKEHNSAGSRGAKCLRGRRPVQLVYRETFPSRSAAAKREYQIKQFDREGKERLVAAIPAVAS